MNTKLRQLFTIAALIVLSLAMLGSSTSAFAQDSDGPEGSWTDARHTAGGGSDGTAARQHEGKREGSGAHDDQRKPTFARRLNS